MKKVLILGNGVSAMYCVMACNSVGIKPTIASNQPKLGSAGAFYLHWLPEEYRHKTTEYFIEYKYFGSAGVYLQKQWKGNIPASSSFGMFHRERGYDPREFVMAYDAYAQYEHINSGHVSDEIIPEMARGYDVTICTFALERNKHLLVQRPVICEKGEYWDNTIHYNGTREDAWIRRSRLFGTQYTEYPDFMSLPPTEGLVVKTVFDIPPYIKSFSMTTTYPSIHMVGRYAQMDRKALAHHAYERSLEILNGSE